MKTNCYELHIGLKDKDNNHHLTLDEVRKDLEEVFKTYSLNFSMSLQQGGYVSENGDFVFEDSVKLVFIDTIEEKRILRFIGAVKKIYNQESILYIRKEIDQEYVGA